MVSVILATYQGDAHVGRALDSLGAQTLAPESFEILLVLNGPACSAPQIVSSFRRRHPQHLVRMMVTATPGASNARNIGLEAALGQYVTFMDDDDYVSPSYLEVLLEAAEPGVVPVAYMTDVDESGEPFGGLRQANYFTGSLLKHAGKIVPAENASSVLSANVAKLVPTAVARQQRYRTDLRSGEDFVYWTEMFAKTQFWIRVAEPRADAIYYRTVRSGSVSRQATSHDFNITQRLDCIEALTSLRQENPAVQRVVRDKVIAQVQHMNRYLLQYPQCREEVLSSIRRRNLPWFPFDTLNEGTAKDLAILYCFVPYQDTSALVSARRIRERGVTTDVISNRLDRVRTVDNWAQEIAHEYIDRSIVTKTPQAMGAWSSIRAFADACIERAEGLMARKGRYRSVYSRAMWPASHFAAAALKARHPSIRWIAEFSDPMLHDVHGEIRADLAEEDELITSLREAIAATGFHMPQDLRMWEWVELIAYALADEIVFTNENQRSYMLGYAKSPELAERAANVSLVAHHPTLPEEFYTRSQSKYCLDPSQVNIGYFGVFYATRGLDEVMAALAGITESARTRLRLHIFTHAADEARTEVDQRGLSDVVVLNDYVPFLEFLNLTTRFDVLIVNDASTKDHHPLNPYLPSKLSDYLGSGTPIWSIVEEQSVLSRMHTEYQSAIGDVSAAKEILLSMADIRTSNVDQERLESEFRHGQAQQLVPAGRAPGGNRAVG
jgi:poly(ribitol-phosphate) beta-N-acetylglucosaminyltransferase